MFTLDELEQAAGLIHQTISPYHSTQPISPYHSTQLADAVPKYEL